MEENKFCSIKKQLKKSGYENKKIDYKEFIILRKKYAPQMSEKEFALLLGVSESMFHSFKYKRDTKVIILKNENALEEDREITLEELKKLGYKNKYINYEEFCKLYKKYGKNLPEYKFAEFLGISKTNFASMKARFNKGQNATAQILKDAKFEEKIENNITGNILEKGLGNSYVTYEEFKELYKHYGSGLAEIEFAHVLGITSADYWHIKHTTQRTGILKKKISEMSEEEINARIKNIKKKNAQIIDYSQFQQFFKKYGKNLNERQFAQILGISEHSYAAMKYRGQRVRIDFGYDKRRKIKEICKESRFYQQDEIEEILKNNKITIEEFIQYAFRLRDENDIINDYKDAYIKNKKLYIGNTIMSKEFVNHNAETLLRLSQTQSRMYGKAFGMMRYNEEIASDVLLVLMEKYGEIAYNFEEAKAIERLTRIARSITKHSYLKKMKLKTSLSYDDVNYRLMKHVKQTSYDDMELY